jgi:hypothetical protein
VTTAFNPQEELIVVKAILEGPSGQSVSVRLALDTASTGTLIGVKSVSAAGYDLANATTHSRLTTASGVHSAPRLTMTKLSALGRSRANFSILAHTLPVGSGIDGLLGLDFIRGGVLTIDFDTGQITLT